MLAPNTILQNRYRIIRQLGQGGMGTVYEAIDERLDMTVALKESHFSDEQLRKQFEREARLLARLRHPSMTRVIDHFQDNTGQYLVMDFIAGEDLSEILNRRGGALPPSEVLAWADQLLGTLDYLHSQEPPVVHRDIKPQNLKLTARNQIILLDFGLAKGFAGQISRVTTSGSIFGYTPNYAPLEQIQGTSTDTRSDLYSLAATLFHLMTGIVPPDVLTRVTTISDGQPDPLRFAHVVNGQVQPQVGDVLNKAMAIGRSHRFSTAAEMRQALYAVRQLQSPSNDSDVEAAILPPTIHYAASDQITQKSNPAQVSSAAALSVNLLPVPSTNPESSITVPQSPIFAAKPKHQSSLPPLIISGIVALVFVGIAIAIISNYNSGTVNTNTFSFNSNTRNTTLTNMPNTGSNTNLSGSTNQTALTSPTINGDSSSRTNNLNKSNSNMSSNAVAATPTIDADPLLFPSDTRSIPYADPRQNASPPSDENNQSFDYNRTFRPSEVTQKARIISKPEPQYTEEARRNQISGTVVLKAVFSSSGQVTNIRAVSSLPYGLTEKAIAAARQIRFSPAQKDGRAVSQYIQIEYNFYPY